MRVYRKRARQDYPADGIKKGQEYYLWRPYRQGDRRSPRPPTRAQLAANDTDREVYGIYDGEPPGSAEALRETAQRLSDLSEAEQEKLDNTPEPLQQGEAGQRLDRRIQALSDAAEQLNALADELDNLEEDHQDDPQEAEDEAREEILGRFGETEPDLS